MRLTYSGFPLHNIKQMSGKISSLLSQICSSHQPERREQHGLWRVPSRGGSSSRHGEAWLPVWGLYRDSGERQWCSFTVVVDVESAWHSTQDWQRREEVHTGHRFTGQAHWPSSLHMTRTEILCWKCAGWKVMYYTCKTPTHSWKILHRVCSICDLQNLMIS